MPATRCSSLHILSAFSAFCSTKSRCTCTPPSISPSKVSSVNFIYLAPNILAVMSFLNPSFFKTPSKVKLLTTQSCSSENAIFSDKAYATHTAATFLAAEKIVSNRCNYFEYSAVCILSWSYIKE